MELDTTLDGPLPPPTPEESTAEGFSSSDAKRAARNAMALTLASISAKGLLFGWLLVLARWLGTEGYGIYGTIGAMLAIGATIPELGMGQIVVRDVAKRPQDAGRYLASTLALQPFFATLGYGSLMIAALLLGYSAEIRTLLALAAVSLLIDALGNMCHNQLLAIERMVITAIVSTAHVVVLIGLAALLLSLGGGLWGLYAATITAGLLRTGVYWIIAWRGFGIRPVFPVDRMVSRGLVLNGTPLALSAFLTLTYQHTDKLLSTALIGEESTGQLTAGFVVVFGVIELLSTTVLVAVFPMMSRTFGDGLREMFEFMIEKLSFFNLVLSLPIAIYISLLAVPLSSLVFGPEYTRTADILQILIWYTVVTMVVNVFAQAMLVQNRQTRLLVIRAGGLVLNVILNLILLPTIGVTGAAIATLCAELVILVLVVRSFAFPAEWWARVSHHLRRLALAGLGLAAVIFLLRMVHPLLAGIAGAPAYLGLVYVTGA
ncbi:MAG: oligosaccharide flippase family protein, partial [Chloroflexi bacterium]|nr:oligosaccharide flippase family protein [Chloroflexota bacterium]